MNRQNPGRTNPKRFRWVRTLLSYLVLASGTLQLSSKYLFGDYVSLQTLQCLLIHYSVLYTCVAREQGFQHTGLTAHTAHIFKKHLLHVVHYP